MSTARWSGPFDFLTSGLAFGDHTLWVHARDVAGNWGPFATASFVLYNANTTGPFTIAVSIAPTDVPTGVPVQLDATLQDWFGDPILAAEFFVDVPGPDGTGTPMSNSSGSQWGRPIVTATWAGNPPLSPGAHALPAGRMFWLT